MIGLPHVFAPHHLAVNQHRQFHSIIVIRDAKWCLNLNFSLKENNSWTITRQAALIVKQGIHSLKLVLFVCWGMESIIYWELL